MKYLFVFLVPVLLFSCKGHKKRVEKNDWDKLNYKSTVKTVITASYFSEAASKNFPSGNYYDCDTERFDTSGFLTEKATYKRDGTLTYQCTYKYDSKHNVIEENKYDHDFTDTTLSADSLVRKLYSYIYSFNKKGIIIGDSVYVNLKFHHLKIWQHDSTGNITTIKSYNTANKLTTVENWKYDGDGNITEYSKSNANGRLINRTTYAFNKQGNIWQKEKYYADGALETKHIYRYNTSNDVTDDIVIDNGKHNKWEYDYSDTDPDGNWLKVSYSENDKKRWVFKRSIDYY